MLQISFFLLLALPTTLALFANCPEGFSRLFLNSRDARCYKLILNDEITMPDARRECAKISSHLAHIDNAFVNYHIAGLVANNTDGNGVFWIGMYCLSDSSCYYDNGTLAQYNNYYKEANYLEPYVQIKKDGKWYERDEDSLNTGFICEYDLPAYGCDVGYVGFGQYCYLQSEIGTPINDPDYTCQMDGNHLATIPDPVTFSALRSVISGEYIAIGLKKTQGSWRWVDGSPVSFLNFDESQPDIDSFQCTFLMRDGTWLKAPCNNRNGGISILCSHKNRALPSTPAITDTFTLPTLCLEPYYIQDIKKGVILSPKYSGTSFYQICDIVIISSSDNVRIGVNVTFVPNAQSYISVGASDLTPAASIGTETCPTPFDATTFSCSYSFITNALTLQYTDFSFRDNSVQNYFQVNYWIEQL